ncbi:MAG: hypothetical protein EPN92_08960 [Chitinophagaceae bacterium]|nr:MAG: hypothetical protein EPN92_08960 [Chitinophagaceae bacterium]
MNEVLTRMKKPTPKFFKKLRNIGLTLTGISAAILTAPVVLPALLVKAAGYLAVAGMVAGTVSQTGVKNEKV